VGPSLERIDPAFAARFRNITKVNNITHGLRKSPFPELLVFIASIMVTILFWTVLPDDYQINENSDYLSFYEPQARKILKGEAFAQTNGTVATRYPPGFPLLLAGIFKAADISGVAEEKMLFVFTATFASVASVFLFMLARTVWGTVLAWVALLIWITYPPFLWLAKQPNSEIPFLVLLYAGFFAFWRLTNDKRSGSLAFVVGVLLGLSMLVRPIAIGIVIVISIMLSLVVRDIKPSAKLLLVTMMLLGNLVTVLPWEGWVYLKTGRIVLLSSGGGASIIDGLTFAVNPETPYRRMMEVDRDVVHLMENIQAATSAIKEVESLKTVTSVVTGKLLTQPVPMAKLYALKTLRAWYATDSQRFETPLFFMQTVYLIFILFGSVAAWLFGGSARKLMLGVWLVVFYFWGMTTMVLSIARYMVPVMGLLIILIPGAVLKIGRIGWPIKLRRIAYPTF
jgi:4-amino-4-deoxy-L-arabinose transferase-like glycosyltransferase